MTPFMSVAVSLAITYIPRKGLYGYFIMKMHLTFISSERIEQILHGTRKSFINDIVLIQSVKKLKVLRVKDEWLKC